MYQRNELQHSSIGDTLKSTQGCTREMTPPKTVQRGVNSLDVNGFTDLANLADKKVRKDLWKLISGVGRGQWVDVILPNKLLVTLYSFLTVELAGTSTL